MEFYNTGAYKLRTDFFGRKRRRYEAGETPAKYSLMRRDENGQMVFYGPSYKGNISYDDAWTYDVNKRHIASSPPNLYNIKKLQKLGGVVINENKPKIMERFWREVEENKKDFGL